MKPTPWESVSFRQRIRDSNLHEIASHQSSISVSDRSALVSSAARYPPGWRTQGAILRDKPRAVEVPHDVPARPTRPGGHLALMPLQRPGMCMWYKSGLMGGGTIACTERLWIRSVSPRPGISVSSRARSSWWFSSRPGRDAYRPTVDHRRSTQCRYEPLHGAPRSVKESTGGEPGPAVLRDRRAPSYSCLVCCSGW